MSSSAALPLSSSCTGLPLGGSNYSLLLLYCNRLPGESPRLLHALAATLMQHAPVCSLINWRPLQAPSTCIRSASAH
ncbi:hypothetical protein GOP47_0013212 [Adiantum capillus-veneris]|uniref:Uncharacterized protein n=1 Tax=Adiantum capillus-veneris TaxID=13818 RepID=A0A9D4ZFK4_ADICA|nr:hypothetical protein GOP47_0013212 [Adiantum capillus-veneris]